MDHRRAITTLLIGLVSVGAAASAPLPLREAAWIAPDSRVAALTLQPAVCTKRPVSEADLGRARTGHVAFNAPLLLGGQAARAGLSCASCHQNGRGNPHFLFPGLSGAAGTADVTSSLMSKHRGDGVFNPKPIPDLAMTPPKINRDPAKRDLETFIRGLIVEEFDGPEPSAATLAGLAAYVRLQVADSCEGKGAPVTLAQDVGLLANAVMAAKSAVEQRDADTARLLLSSARSALGRIHERYAGPALASDRAAIKKWDAELAIMQSGIVDGATTAQDLRDWMDLSLGAIRTQLPGGEAKSLYNPARLKKALLR